MSNLLYWMLRAFFWLLAVVAVYFAIMHSQGRLWLQVSLVAVVVIFYSLIDQPLRGMRGRKRAR
jgi:hypothetical protein